MEALKWYGGADADVLSGSFNLLCSLIFGLCGYKGSSLARLARSARKSKKRRSGSSFLRIFLCYIRFSRSERVRYLNMISRIACMARTSRALVFLHAHEELFDLDVFANYVLPRVGDDMFHHISRRYYLAKNLSLRKRVLSVLCHHHFEEHVFDAEYKRKVYASDGLVLWEESIGTVEFQIRLMLADRYAAEGDLCIALMVDGARLHAVSFSWFNEGLGEQNGIGIFVGLNQGRWQKDHDYQDKFHAAFPNNSANFVCYAALQGLARAVGAKKMIGVSGTLQVCFSAKKNRSFDNAYDEFWQSVGGVPDTEYGFTLPIPWPKKDLSTLPSKHRKRAAGRRVLLDAVEAQTFVNVARHFRGVCSQDHTS